MTLTPGGTLLHYRIVEKLGEGGMGEVWKAVDTTLDREVAIKLLPTDAASDGDRLARFEREAKLLASLNHPHIAAIHGLHAADDTHFLAMELVSGEDLDQRLDRGPLPFDEALKIARQLATALEVAHRAGVIHRDLKPANIRLTASGDVKVLDFGLAKALTPESAADGQDPAQSPTVTSLGTVAGVILGTAAYMAPEQARGQEVDERADIWAFGVVLYEMLGGRPLFADKSVSDTMAAVLTREPDWDAVPFSVRRLLRACMEKERDERLRSIADAWLLLDDERDEVASAASAGGRWSTAAAALLVGAIITAASFTYLRPTSVPPMTTFLESPPAGGRFAWPPVPSPDGHHLAMVVNTGDGQSDSGSIWIRSFDELEARKLEGTEGAGLLLAWSPAGEELLFKQGNDILRISRDGGPTQFVTSVPAASEAAWLDNGDLLVSSPLGVLLVPRAGGEPRLAGSLDNWTFSGGGPGSLGLVPDAGQIFYYRVGEQWGVHVASIDGSKSRRLDFREFTRMRHLDSGYVVLQRRGRLQARRYDPGAMDFVGEAVHIADGVHQYRFDAGRSETITFIPYEYDTDRIVRLDRNGQELEVLAPAANYDAVRVSPNSPHYGYVKVDPDNLLDDVWVRGFADAGANPIAQDPRVEHGMVFSSDGNEVIWEAHADGGSTFMRRPRDRSQPAQPMNFSFKETGATITDWHDDLLFYTSNAESSDMWAISTIEESPQPIEVRRNSFDETEARISPDGRWVAFMSDEAGPNNVYVQRINGAVTQGEAIRVSREQEGGGRTPQWSTGEDGYQLYYKAGSSPGQIGSPLMVVDVPAEGDEFVPVPRELFKLSTFVHYDVMPDGQSILAIVREMGPPRPAVVIRNWRPEGR